MTELVGARLRSRGSWPGQPPCSRPSARSLALPRLRNSCGRRP